MSVFRAVLGILALVVAVLVAAWWWAPRQDGPDAHLPWHLVVRDDRHVEAMGWSIGTSTVAEAAGRSQEWGLIKDPDGRWQLESYADPYLAGSISGKLVLLWDVPADRLESLAKTLEQQGHYREPQPSGAWKWKLDAAQLAGVSASTLSAMEFLPAGRLPKEAILQRFGPAAETRQEGGQTTWAWPAKGLVISRAEQGKVVMQLTSPGAFRRLWPAQPASTPAPAQR
mgnify:CR=1 FL=1